MLSKVSRHRFRFSAPQGRKNNLGRLFEHTAAQFLLKRGYFILEQNWRTKSGEIDCIALTPTKDCVVIVEVKARAKEGNFSVRAAVDYRKRSQLYFLGQTYFNEHKHLFTNKSFRFDVIRITFEHLENDFTGVLEHIEHALHHGFTLNFTSRKTIRRNRYSKR